MSIQFAPVTNEETSTFDLESDKYLFKPLALEETPDNGYGEGYKWVLNVASRGNDGKFHTMLDSDGKPFEFWHFTNKPKNGGPMGPKNRTRILIEAILGHALGEGEAVTDAQILGGYFLGLVGPKIGQDGKSRQRILSVEPFTHGSAPVAAPEPTPAAPATADEMPF